MSNWSAANFSLVQPANYSSFPEQHQTQLAKGKSELTTWTIVQVLAYYAMILLSLIGNTIVIKAIKRIRSNLRRQLHYLFIVNLSVSDLLFAVENIPMVCTYLLMNGSWKIEGSLGSFLCKFNSFTSLVLILTSNLTILAIGVERFCGTFSPLKVFISKKRAYFMIACTWLVSGIYSSPLLSSCFADLERSPDGSMRCHLYVESQKVIHWFVLQTVLLAAGFVTTLVLYTAIGIKIWRGKTPGIQLKSVQLRMHARKIKAVKMLAILVTVFYISFIPFSIYQLSVFFGFHLKLGSHYGQIAAFLMYCNGAINPVIYSVYNESIRNEFKALFNCKKIILNPQRSLFLTSQITRRLKNLGFRQFHDTRDKAGPCQPRGLQVAVVAAPSNLVGFAFEETRL